MLKNRLSYLGIFLFCSLIILADCILISRYQSWGFSLSQLLCYLIALFLAETVTVISVLTYKQLINPYSLYAVFIYIYGYSFLNISDKQNEYSFSFTLICLLSIFSFLLGSLFVGKLKTISFSNIFPKLNNKFSLIFTHGLVVISTLVFVSEIKQLGYLPLLNLGNLDVYSDLNSNNVTPMHNFIVLCALLPTIYYIHYKRRAVRGSILLVITLWCGFILLNYLSRQIIILSLLSFVIAINYYNQISTAKMLIYLSAFALCFVALGSLRSSSNVEEDANSFLKVYGEINKPTNIAETYLSLYGAVNFTEGNIIIKSAKRDQYLAMGRYTIRPIIASLPFDKNTVYPVKYSSYDLLGTYLTDPYLDFGWLGVVILNFLYGAFSINSFKKYLNKISEYAILEWTLVAFCILMASFTNYVNTFFVFFLYIISRITIK